MILDWTARKRWVRFGSKVPGQQIGDVADRVVGNVLQHHAQVGLRINAVQLGRTNQTVYCGSAFATRVGTREEIVLPSQSRLQLCVKTAYQVDQVKVDMVEGSPSSVRGNAKTCSVARC